MWNNWTEKAKTFAANIDQQINDSVGLEDGETNATGSTAANDGTTATMLDHTSGNNNDDANAWNDDFDDNFDTFGEQSKPTMDVVAPAATKTTTSDQLQSDQPDADIAQPVPEKVSPPSPSPPQIEAPAPEIPAVSEQKMAPVIEPDVSEDEDPPAENGWSNEDDDNLDDSDDAEPAATISAPKIIPPTPVAEKESVTVEENLESTESNFDALPEKLVEVPIAEPPIKADVVEPTAEIEEEPQQEEHKEEATTEEESNREDEQPEAASAKAEPAPASPRPPVAVAPQKVESATNASPSASAKLGGPAALSKATSMFSSFSKVASPLGSSFLQQADALIHKAVENGDSAAEGGLLQENSDDDDASGADDDAWDDDGLNLDSPVSAEKKSPTIEEPSATKSELLTETKDAPTTTPSFQSLSTATTPVNVPSTEPSSSTPSVAVLSSAATNGDVVNNAQYQELLKTLQLREGQLASKAEQLAQLQNMWESTEQELKQQIQGTKDEAKKRIQRARERCEVAEAKLAATTNKSSETNTQQAELIAALRSEGGSLARKQSEMEKAVRAAKGEARELKEYLDSEMAEKTKALARVEQLEAELKTTKDSLNRARQGESVAGQLENELLEARSDAEQKAGRILSLEQLVKELKALNKDLEANAQQSQKSLSVEAERETKKLRREHNDVISDLEQKLRVHEKEAAGREDDLRREVSEIRKRWEDAVRRADALSMDIQLSTAPLLRQLESKERENRIRSAAWAELETKLRSDLEEAVIQNDAFNNQRGDLKSKASRLERLAAEREKMLNAANTTIEEQTTKIQKLETQLSGLEKEAEKRKQEYAEVERLANEGVARVRSEMTQTVVESEDRYRNQIDRLQTDLAVEREKRSQLETQVQQLLDDTASLMAAPTKDKRGNRQKKLRQAEGQADILAGALVGLDGTDAQYDDDDDDDDDDEDETEMVTVSTSEQSGIASFAAHEQLTSKLKVAQVECKALRASLRESEKTREKLLGEMVADSGAKERLDEFEARVQELEAENREKEMEIQGLQSDIVEVKELYRTQLNMLLEEKAAAAVVVVPNTTNDQAPPASTNSPETEASEQVNKDGKIPTNAEG